MKCENMFTKQSQAYVFSLKGALVAFLSICILISSGCSSRLTRTKAQELIRKDYPKKETTDLVLWIDIPCGPWVSGKGFQARPCTQSDIHELNAALQSEGLIKISFEGNFMRSTLTESGKKWAVGEVVTLPQENGLMGMVLRQRQEVIKVVTRELDLDNITGIAESKELGVAKVEYTIKKKVTPFGKTMYKLQDETIAGPPIICKKYDDGWRIEK